MSTGSSGDAAYHPLSPGGCLSGYQKLPPSLWCHQLEFHRSKNSNTMSLSIANLGVAGALLLVWLFLSGRHDRQGEKGLRRPPTLPSIIPFVGHLPEFVYDGGKLLRKAAYVGTGEPETSWSKLNLL